MKKKDASILVFDSGLGGLSVLRELVQLLPNERYIYFGDSANAPYGSRSTDEVRALTLAAVAAQADRGLKAIVVACNTATAAAISELREKYPDHIVIGVEPALKLAIDRRPGGRVAVMATNVTLREAKFARLMERFSADSQIIPLPCPGLVEFVESGALDTPELQAYLRQLLEPVLSQGVDSIVLGCTHFPFLRPVIARLVGEDVEILDGSLGTAQQTRRRLEAAELLRTEGSGSIELYNSLGTPQILALSAHLLEQPL